MFILSIEERLSALEAEVTEIRKHLSTDDHSPWWEKIYGTFAESEEYEEAMRLGREYRESLRPKEDKGSV